MPHIQKRPYIRLIGAALALLLTLTTIGGLYMIILPIRAAENSENLITPDTRIQPSDRSKVSYENGVLKMGYSEDAVGAYPAYSMNFLVDNLTENFTFSGKLTVTHVPVNGDDAAMNDMSIWNGLRILCGGTSAAVNNSVSLYRRVGAQIVNNGSVGIGSIVPYFEDATLADGESMDFVIYRRGNRIVFTLNGNIVLDHTLTAEESLFAGRGRDIGFISLNMEFEVSDMKLYNDDSDINIEVKKYINIPENLPVVTLPGITQAQFADSFQVLEEALVRATPGNPIYGFENYFCGPGGAYGPCWWQLDTSLATSSLKWVNLDMAEGILRGFMGVQQENGRIALHGPDVLLNEENKCSSLPKLFTTAYDILCMTDDDELTKDTYTMLKKYLDWWFDARYNPENGLIRGIVEEWLPGSNEYTYPVETSVEVAIGCKIVATLADHLGYTEDAALCRSRYTALVSAINEKMYNPEIGAYMGLAADGKTFNDIYLVTAFNPLRAGMADAEYHESLLHEMTRDDLFNWDSKPLTSASKTDPRYNETDGDYAAIQWYGCIWSLRSYDVICGLTDIGRYDLAAYLSWRTVQLFNDNYAEFLNPTTGEGNGVLRYSWTASQYAQLIIENIFGVKYDRFANTLTIAPQIDSSLYGETLKLENLSLPDGNKLNLTILPGESTTISYEIVGDIPVDYDVSIKLPHGEKAYVGEFETVTEGYSTVAVKMLGKASSGQVVFTSEKDLESESTTEIDSTVTTSASAPETGPAATEPVTEKGCSSATGAAVVGASVGAAAIATLKKRRED